MRVMKDVGGRGRRAEGGIWDSNGGGRSYQNVIYSISYEKIDSENERMRVMKHVNIYELLKFFQPSIVQLLAMPSLYSNM